MLLNLPGRAVIALAALAVPVMAGSARVATLRPSPDLTRLVSNLQVLTIATEMRTLRHEIGELPLDPQSRARSLVPLLTALQRVQPDRITHAGPPCAEVFSLLDTVLGTVQDAQWRRGNDALKTAIADGAARYKAAIAPLTQTQDPLEQADCLARSLTVLTGAWDDAETLHPSGR